MVTFWPFWDRIAYILNVPANLGVPRKFFQWETLKKWVKIVGSRGRRDGIESIYIIPNKIYVNKHVKSSMLY